MVTLSESQRQIVQAHNGEPIAVMDDQTRQVYYLISAEQYEQVRALLTAEPFDPRELYPLISKTAAEAGWADPQMDDYDRYDEVRAKTESR
jgi:PHD/YefM family antitoxin component YafN of YafNO toxin-antitoxin module